MRPLGSYGAPLLLFLSSAACELQRPIPLAETMDAGALHVVRTNPANGATCVATNSAVDVDLDFVPDPDSVGPMAVRPTSGGYYWLGVVRVELARRRLELVTRHPFFPETEYEITVAPTIGDGYGQTLGQKVRFGFTTGSGPAATSPPPGVTLTADVEPIFAAHCTTCHGAGGADGLDLSSVAQANATLVGQPAVETQDEVRVAPGDSAHSFLLRKLLGVPPATSHALGGAQAPSPAELDVIEDWIDGGAI